MSSSVVGGWNRGRFDNAVVFVRDFRARLSDSDNVMGGFEEVAVDCDWQVQARHDSTSEIRTRYQGLVQLVRTLRGFRCFANRVCDVRKAGGRMMVRGLDAVEDQVPRF